MTMRAWTFLLAILAVASTPRRAEALLCEVFRSPVQLGQDATIEMITVSGKDCRVRFHRRDVFEVETSEVSARPLHGGARVHAPLTAYYRSNPNFRGRDHFIFTLCGTQGERTGCSSVHVKVVVH
jgi:hypothetical protein